MAYEIVPCLYDTYKDLQSRLHGTICRYDNQPYYVSVQSERSLWLYDLPDVMTGSGADSSKCKKIDPTDPLFDISSPELGYMNYDPLYLKKITTITGNIVVRVVRTPIRQWKQGLNTDCISLSGIDDKARNFGLNYNQIMFSQGTKDMILGVYPKLPEAVIKLARFTNEKYQQVAVSRDVALEKTGSEVVQVYVKGKNVGYILPGERVIHLKKEENSWVTRKYLEALKAGVV